MWPILWRQGRIISYYYLKLKILVLFLFIEIGCVPQFVALLGILIVLRLQWQGRMMLYEFIQMSMYQCLKYT